jgi:glucose/arabinose dehydrogenase
MEKITSLIRFLMNGFWQSHYKLSGYSGIMKSHVFFCLFIFLSFSGTSQSLPANFSTQVIGSGWNQPVGLTFSPNGAVMFVWEKGGRIYTVVNGVKSSTPLLSISEEVGNWRDHGLVGFAVDPNFNASGGYIYLLYAVDRHHLLHFGTANYSVNTNEYFNATIGRLTRYTVTGSGANWSVNPNSRQVLLGESKSTGFPILHESHGAGCLAFGSDGTLLVSTGDGSSYNGVDVGAGTVGVNGYNANDSIAYTRTYAQQALADGIITAQENVGSFKSQLLTSLSGKVLRLDPATGNGVPSNPYFDAANPRSARSRMWALGFRNPYRMSRRPDTGSSLAADGNPGVFYIGDVGFGEWEELSVINGPAQNFGWPLFEGLEANSAYPFKLTRNLSAPNPLANGGSCAAYFSFRDLVKQPVVSGSVSFPNPCNTSQPIPAAYSFVHQRPIMDWHHGAGPSRVGTFSGNTASVANVGAAGSPVSGAQFGGNAATAGVWYTGDDFPAQYKNTYFCADYGGGWIRNLQLDGLDNLQAVNNFVNSGLSVVCMATHPTQGGLYYIQYGGDPFVQEVRKVYFSGNYPPQAVASANQTYGPGPLNVQFTGSNSTDPEAGALSYLWDFGDGTPTSTAANPSHIFSASAGVPTKFDVTLTVTDNQGDTSVAKIIISVNNTPPVVKITSPVNNSKYSLDQATIYNLTANVTDQEQGANGLTYQWQTILFHNNHNHPDPYDNNPVTTTEISPVGCDGETYFFRITLTVTDAAGLSATDQVDVYPDCSFLAANVVEFVATVGNEQVTLNWTNPTPQADEIMIVAKPAGSITASPSGDGSGYVANLSYTGNGSAFDGGKVVYKGLSPPQTITNLTNNTTYFFKAFSRASSEWSPGVEVIATPVCPLPTLQATDLTFSNVTSNGLTLNWSSGNGTSRVVKINTSNAFVVPANGTSPAANAVYQGSGEQVVYNGIGNTVNISGLNPGVTYYFQVYEYNCTGTSTRYLTTGGSNNPNNATTTGGANCTASGTILREVWNNVMGTGVSAIPVNSTPSSSSQATLFESPSNIGDNYAQRMRGYLCVPTTGNYTFWIASDNDGELWLSTDDNPANKQRIAFIQDNFAYARQWDKLTSQKSAPIALVAGRSYYIEALHKEAFGGDNLAVGWTLPNGTQERPIPGNRLSPFASSNQLPVVSLTAPANNATFALGANITLTATASDADGSIAKVEFFNGATKLGESLSSPYSYTLSNAQAGSYQFTARATDNIGAMSTSTAVNVTVSKATPVVSWAKPADITQGTALSGAQLNASANVAGSFVYTPASGTVLAQGNNQTLSVVFTPTDQNNYNPANASVLINVLAAANCTASGTILREVWNNVTGTTVASIPLASPPSASSQVTSFEGPVNAGDNYAARYRGYICVPASGNYTFWIAGDNDCALWLSTDNSPANKQRIAFVENGFTYPNEWTKYPSQRSALINLVAGRSYYIEALHKEAFGGDNLQVGWQLPNGTLERSIPGSRLSPFVPAGSRLDMSAELVNDYSLIAAPNPFSDQTTVRFTTREAERVSLQLFDLRGSLVKTLFDGYTTDKRAEPIILESAGLGEGIYILRMHTANKVIHQRLVIAR